MKQPKLRFIAISSVLLLLCIFSCNKDRSGSPPATTTSTTQNTPIVTDCNNAANSPEKTVCLSNAFLATLTASQLASAQLSLSQTTAVHWSNLPCGPACRNGLEFADMTPAQVTAAKAIIASATGTGTGVGYDAISQIMGMDSAGFYFIAFLDTPSMAGTWQLQFGGHNVAVNISYKSGAVTGPTPMFLGADPNIGTTLAKGAPVEQPLAGGRSAMAAMLASLSSDQLARARLTTTFSDVMLGPGMDGNFPAVKAGVDVSSLSTPQQDLIRAAIGEWVQNADSATAASLMIRYTRDFSGTYIAFSNTPYLTSNRDYVRIDGPRVWIEFICLSEGAGSSQVHYNSVWRDHRNDYGGNFIF